MDWLTHDTPWLMQGDCLFRMSEIPSGSVDLILADLPFGSTRARWDTQIDLAALWRQYRRIAKPSAAILLFAQTPFDKVLGASNLKDLRYEWIWEKGNATGHMNAKRAPLKAHENILVFYRRQPTYHPQKTAGHPRKTATKRKDVTQLYGAQSFEALPYDSTERYPRSVLRFPSDKQRSKLHSTQKPIALCEHLILTYSNPGDVVLDNCAGSFTTGVASLNLGRRFIGIERDPTHFRAGSIRIVAILAARRATQPQEVAA